MDSNRISRNELLFCEALTQKCTMGNESLNFASPGELNCLFQRKKKKKMKTSHFPLLSFNLCLIIWAIFCFVLASRRPKSYRTNSAWIYLHIFVSIHICLSVSLLPTIAQHNMVTFYKQYFLWWGYTKDAFCSFWALCNALIAFKMAEKICANS